MKTCKRKIGKTWKIIAALFTLTLSVIVCGKSVQAAGRPVSISSCQIAGGNVNCTLTASSVPSGDDGKYYIYADEVFQDGPVGTVVASVDAGSSVTASFSLNYNTPDSNLSRKFLVAVKRGGQMIQVSDEHYITNPEAVAAFTSGRMTRGIKGILPEISAINSGELKDLGVQQVVYNIYLDEICAAPGDAGTLPFSYNGQTYYFSHGRIDHYDQMVKGFNNQGMQVTMVLLNRGGTAGSQDLVHPLARGGAECPSYALNVEESGGVEHLKAVCAFLGQRYSGKTGNGQIDNWILGNEVNARTSWWYMDSANLDVNVSAYVKAFRIFYNELKAMNANIWVYNSIDQEWGRKSNPGSFLAKDYLDQFNYYINREGNIDWGLSYHPYNSPLYDPYAWNGPAVWVKQSVSTPYITMQNIDILIDYMHQGKFLNPAGQVRSISLAEIGYTSYFGNENQEASVAYGYLKAASLPDVDAFMLFRFKDDAHEMESKLNLGLTNLDGSHKPAYDIYKQLGTGSEGAAKARASEIIGMDIDQMIRDNVVWTRGGDGVVQ